MADDHDERFGPANPTAGWEGLELGYDPHERKREIDTDAGMLETPVGPDTLRLGHDAVFIDAAREMETWVPSIHRRTIIVVRGKEYFVASKTDLERGRVRYELRPWADDATERPRARFVYNVQYVQQREQLVTLQSVASNVDLALTFLSPLVGFLPAATKLRWSEQYGFNAHAAQRRSLYLELFLAMALPIPTMALAFPLVLMLPYSAMLVDLAVRFSRVISEDPKLYGFYEWLVPRRSDH